jgi:hypothetical protein
MKKTLITLAFIVVTGTLSLQAQEIGVRFGDVVGNTVAIDAIFGTGLGRTHADLSFGELGVGLEALWQQ